MKPYASVDIDDSQQHPNQFEVEDTFRNYNVNEYKRGSNTLKKLIYVITFLAILSLVFVCGTYVGHSNALSNTQNANTNLNSNSNQNKKDFNNDAKLPKVKNENSNTNVKKSNADMSKTNVNTKSSNTDPSTSTANSNTSKEVPDTKTKDSNANTSNTNPRTNTKDSATNTSNAKTVTSNDSSSPKAKDLNTDTSNSNSNDDTKKPDTHAVDASTKTDTSNNDIKDAAALEAERLQCEKDRQYFEGLVDSIKSVELKEKPAKIYDVTLSVHNYKNKNYRYEDRFSPYYNIDREYTHYLRCNALLDLPKRTALYIQMRGTKEIKQDYLTYLRAMLIEVGWKLKIDAYVVLHVDSHESFDINFFPKELHSILIPVTEADVTTPFVGSRCIAIEAQGNQFICYLRSAMRDGFFLTDMWFAQKFPQYEFIWSGEDDVKVTAPWSEFLGDVTNQCNAAMEVPHLIIFSPIVRKEDNFERFNGWNVDLIPPKHQYKTMTNFRRSSKKLIEAYTLADKNGQTAIVEYFVPSMASQHELDICTYIPTIYSFDGHENYIPRQTPKNKFIHYVNVAPHENAFPMSSTFDFSFDPNIIIWNQWRNKQIEYMPMTIMHPVKINT